MNQMRVNTIVNRAKDPLRLAILLGGVWARKMDRDPVGGEERAHSNGVELLAIICLKCNDG